MAAHRYWRLLNRKNNGDGSFTGLTEIQMRTVSGGSNVCSGGTATSSTPIQAGSAAQCFDGDTTTTIWQVSGTGSCWIGYDFGAGNSKDIVEVVVWPDKDSAARAFRECDIQWSDDSSTWTTVWSWTYSGWVVGTGAVFTKPSAVASRYWRVRCNTAVSGNNLSCAEMEMRLTSGGPDQTGSGTAFASTTFGSNPGTNDPSKAFDNNTSTLWSGSDTLAQTSWIAYDFGSGVTKAIAEISYTARNDVNYTQSPTSGWVESSTDGTNYLSRLAFSGLTWTSGSTNIITVAATGGRRRVPMML